VKILNGFSHKIKKQKTIENAIRDGVPRVRSLLCGWRMRAARAEHPF